MCNCRDKCLNLHTKKTKLQWNNYQDLLECYNCRRDLRRFNGAVGGCFLPGLLGKLLVHRTQQISQSNSQGGSAQSACCVPSLRYVWEVFYPCCGLWFVQYHLLSQVPASLKYTALRRPVSFMTAEIPIFIVLLMKITHHTFFLMEKD